jgi:hypothetical protein
VSGALLALPFGLGIGLLLGRIGGGGSTLPLLLIAIAVFLVAENATSEDPAQARQARSTTAPRRSFTSAATGAS